MFASTGRGVEDTDEKTAAKSTPTYTCTPSNKHAEKKLLKNRPRVFQLYLDRAIVMSPGLVHGNKMTSASRENTRCQCPISDSTAILSS
jgi:hypothetical protein